MSGLNAGSIATSSISNLSGTVSVSTAKANMFPSGVLQTMFVEDSSLMTFSSAYVKLGNLGVNFTPISATSKVVILANFSARNTSTESWTLYTARIRVGDAFPYYRYVGAHYFNSYMPVQIAYQVPSWGLTTRVIEIQASPHASNVHQYNSKVWDPAAGAANNTSTLLVMEVETL
jgi:hypothetical protein